MLSGSRSMLHRRSGGVAKAKIEAAIKKLQAVGMHKSAAELKEILEKHEKAVEALSR